MAYTTIDKPSDYFNTVLYTGTDTSGTGTVTGVGFQPDFVWGKIRSTTGQHNVYDSVRGVGKRLIPNGTDQEETNAAFGYLSAFDSDGFTTSAGSTNNENFNRTGETFVAWNWYTGATASSNTDGSITSSVSVNTTAGFSIVSYTGTGSAATVGHGLGAIPKVIIVKGRTHTNDWRVQHGSLGATKALNLNDTSAASTATGNWNDTEPTSSVFSLGTFGATNNNTSTFIAYCFVEKKGFSRFGSYVGNGSNDGSYIHLGFKPAWVLIKRTSTTGGWQLIDNKRKTQSSLSDNDPMNPIEHRLESQGSGSEDFSSTYAIDFLSNGFKLRGTSAERNGSGNTFIYLAFAESPFVSSSGIPTTAR